MVLNTWTFNRTITVNQTLYIWLNSAGSSTREMPFLHYFLDVYLEHYPHTLYHDYQCGSINYSPMTIVVFCIDYGCSAGYASAYACLRGVATMYV